MHPDSGLYSLLDRCRERSGPQPRLPALGGVRYCGHWAELLGDLSLVGALRMVIDEGALSLTRTLDPAGLRVVGGIARHEDSASAFRLTLERCHALSGSVAEDGLVRIEDAGRRAILTLRPAQRDSASGSLLRMLLRSHGAAGAWIVPLPASGETTQTALGELIATLDAIDDGIPTLDALELAGRLDLDPRRLREHGSCLLVDKDLVPCVFDSLAHQAMPIEILAGGPALVQRATLVPYAARLEGTRLQLLADDAELNLDIGAVDSAWVLRPRDTPQSHPQLRLYDDDGRAIAVLRHPPPAGSVTARIWSTLINALTD